MSLKNAIQSVSLTTSNSGRTRRLMGERKRYEESNLASENIFVSFDDNDITNLTALIIGPKDTPYEGGFYFFKFNFPERYPFLPPKVKFMTLKPEVRFNPNLYTCGKVCLSILGTWAGPGWTSVMTLKTVLLSLQTLLNENPIQNEPGYENVSKTDSQAVNYNNILRYHNISFAVLEMLLFPPFKDPKFIEIMEEYFYQNYEKYRDTVKLWKSKVNDTDNKKPQINSIYGMGLKPDYDQLLMKLEDMYKIICDKR